MTQRQPALFPSDFSHFQEVTKVMPDHDFWLLTAFLGSSILSAWQ